LLPTHVLQNIGKMQQYVAFGGGQTSYVWSSG
jgi:hypothetical protein